MFNLFKKRSSNCCTIKIEEVKEDCCPTEEKQACCPDEEAQECCEANS